MTTEEHETETLDGARPRWWHKIIAPAGSVPRDWLLSDLDRMDGRRDPLAGDVRDDEHEHLRRVIGGRPLGERDVWSQDPDRMTRNGWC